MIVGSVAAVVDAVAEDAGLDPSDVLGTTRTDEVCHARFCCWFVLRWVFGMSNREISRFFPSARGKEHMCRTTVLHGIRRAEDDGPLLRRSLNISRLMIDRYDLEPWEGD